MKKRPKVYSLVADSLTYRHTWSCYQNVAPATWYCYQFVHVWSYVKLAARGNYRGDSATTYWKWIWISFGQVDFTSQVVAPVRTLELSNQQVPHPRELQSSFNFFIFLSFFIIYLDACHAILFKLLTYFQVPKFFYPSSNFHLSSFLNFRLYVGFGNSAGLEICCCNICVV